MIGIRPYEESDREALTTLLRTSGLSTMGLFEDSDLILVATDRNGLAGSVAIERYGDAGLLRSVATGDHVRGTGLGSRLVAEAETAGYAMGLRRLYLLTETAEGFFDHLGYSVVDRAEIPDAVRASTQFATLCPASATAMTRILNG